MFPNPHMTSIAVPSSPTWQARLRARRSLVAPAVAALGAALVRILGWRGPDIPAQVYRVSLFRTYGFVLWDNGWYGGHYQLPYSVLFPPLGARMAASRMRCCTSIGMGSGLQRRIARVV